MLVGANAKFSWLNLSNTLRELVWRTQITIPDGTGLRRLDLVIESNGQCLFVVENKVASGIQLYKAELDEDKISNEIENENSNTKGRARNAHDGKLVEVDSSEESGIELRNQLECYGSWLAKQPKPSGWKGGLTLLTHFTTPPDDFLGANVSGYGPVWRYSSTWSKVYQWLIRQKPNLSKAQQSDGESTWRILAQEFADFLKEKNMSEEQLTSSDVAAAQIFVGSADRVENTFKHAYQVIQKTADRLRQSRRQTYEFDPEGRLIFECIYLNKNYAPENSWWHIAWGIRFPDHSACWKDAQPPLPAADHVFVCVGGDKTLLPLELLKRKDLPKGWSISEADQELFIARPVTEFLQRPDEFGKMFGEWVNERMLELEKFLPNRRK